MGGQAHYLVGSQPADFPQRLEPYPPSPISVALFQPAGFFFGIRRLPQGGNTKGPRIDTPAVTLTDERLDRDLGPQPVIVALNPFSLEVDLEGWVGVRHPRLFDILLGSPTPCPRPRDPARICQILRVFPASSPRPPS
jgi:hypothetical protein